MPLLIPLTRLRAEAPSGAQARPSATLSPGERGSFNAAVSMIESCHEDLQHHSTRRPHRPDQKGTGAF